MLIIPVIDIKDGKCVRVVQGHSYSTEFYSESPVQIARLFRKENFKTIHITDLDGALNGEMRNFNVIKKISESVDIPIQLGGGVRDFETAKRMVNELGVYRLVIGTAAITHPDFIKKILDELSPSKLVICIDEKDNNVVRNGWLDCANITPLEFAVKMDALGVKRIIYQDVARVGHLCGPNISRIQEIAANTKLKITAAGGICDYRDLKRITDLKIPSIDSVMISRALYENKFPCQRLWRDLEMADTSLELPKAF
jgi:phosphoribosylformimino-5-aminoimidazole carboxamide ribotide isomerase